MLPLLAMCSVSTFRTWGLFNFYSVILLVRTLLTWLIPHPHSRGGTEVLSKNKINPVRTSCIYLELIRISDFEAIVS